LRARPSITKRAREVSRAEQKKDKAEKRAQRREEKASQASLTSAGEDPDIAGIKPGPQRLDPELFGPLATDD